MKKWNLVIDVAKCFNCNNCALACHDEYYDNSHPGYTESMPRLGHRWVDIVQRETGKQPMVEVSYMPIMCNHCDDAPCIKAAENNAVTKRDDGIVLIDPEKSKGQKQIVDACPYNAVFWNEEKLIPQAWPFDAHLLDQGWKQTRGCQACPTGAMETLLVEDDEMQQLARKQELEVLKPELGHRPRVYYKNLQRMRDVFIGGSVYATTDGIEECIEGINVVLEGGESPRQVSTDTFGDFKFTGLKPDGRQYTLRIDSGQYRADTIPVKLLDSVYVGAIQMDQV